MCACIPFPLMRFSFPVLGLFLLGTQISHGTIVFSENFDGGGVNSAFAYTNTTGSAPSTQNVGGANGNVARLTNNDSSNNNSIAFNAVNIPSTPVLRLSFDFFMSADPTGGQSADGLGIGFFPSAILGVSGGVNPVTLYPGTNWESVNFPAGSGALAVGMRIYESNALHFTFNGTQLATGDASFQLNSGQWHRGILTITDQGANSVADLSFISDINGAALAGGGFTNQLLTGVDLDALGSSYRLVAGGRTGGAFVTGELDNISLEAIPEPSVTLLGAVGALSLFTRRRRA